MAYFDIKGVTFYGINSEYFNKSFASRVLLFLSRKWSSKNWITTKQLARVFSKNHFDLVHFHSSISLSLFRPKWKKNSKIIYTDHDSIFDIRTKHHFSFDFDFTPFLSNLKLLDGVSSPSEKSLEKISDICKKTDIISKVIRNGYKASKSSIPKNYKSIRALFPGGSNSVKMLNTLLYNLEQVDLKFLEQISFKLIVLGDTELFIRSYVSQSHINPFIEFKGHLLGASYYKELEHANIYINNSASEVMPLALLEAMSYNLVPLVKTVGGIPEIIQNEQNGILFADENFSDAMGKLGNLQLLEIISENNRKIIPKYTWENITEDYVYFYDSLIK
jgi:glycosyltransferase involved in cell wall biosynthesis